PWPYELCSRTESAPALACAVATTRSPSAVPARKIPIQPGLAISSPHPACPDATIGIVTGGCARDNSAKAKNRWNRSNLRKNTAAVAAMTQVGYRTAANAILWPVRQLGGFGGFIGAL